MNPLLIPTTEEVEALAMICEIVGACETEGAAKYLRALDAERHELRAQLQKQALDYLASDGQAADLLVENKQLRAQLARARNEALEEATKACEQQSGCSWNDDRRAQARFDAKCIRSLMTPEEE